MPYISVNLSKKLEPGQGETLKTAIGETITLLNGKTETVLMLDIADGKPTWFAGKPQENSAFVDVRLYGSQSFKAKSDFTKAMFEVFERVLSIGPDSMFLGIKEYDTWGTRGTLK